MKAFTVALFLLSTRIVSAAFGTDTRDVNRRHLLDAAGKVPALDMAARRTKTIKSKSTKVAKTSMSDDISSISMSYITSFDTAKSQKRLPTKDTKGSVKSKESMRGKSGHSEKSQAKKSKGDENQKGPTKSKEGTKEKSGHSDKSEAHTLFKGGEKQNDSAKSKDGTMENSGHSEKSKAQQSKGPEKQKGSARSNDGSKGKRGRSEKSQAKKSEGTEKQNGSVKSKESSKEKNKHSDKSQAQKSKGNEKHNGSAKSKEASKDKSGHSEKSQKASNLVKQVRSSLPDSSAVDEEQPTNTLISANVANSAFGCVFNGAFLLAMSLVVICAH